MNLCYIYLRTKQNFSWTNCNKCKQLCPLALTGITTYNLLSNGAKVNFITIVIYFNVALAQRL